MKNKLKIILLLIGLSIGISVTVWFTISNPLGKVTSSSQKTETTETKAKDEQIKQTTDLTDDEISKLTNEEKDDFVMGDGKAYDDNVYKIDNKHPEYSEEQAKLLEKQFLGYASTASYDKIVETMKSKVETNNFTTGTNLKVASIYHDASIMLTANTIPKEHQGKIVKGMTNPEMIVIGTMMLSEPARRDVIIDKDSLSPIFSGAVKIISSEDKTLDKKDIEAQRIWNQSTGGKFIQKIVFEIEGNELIAYVMGYKDATIELYGVYAPEGSKYNYQSIRFWEKTRPNN